MFSAERVLLGHARVRLCVQCCTFSAERPSSSSSTRIEPAAGVELEPGGGEGRVRGRAPKPTFFPFPLVLLSSASSGRGGMTMTERQHRFNVMLSGHEISVLKALSASVGISASAYVRALILRAARDQADEKGSGWLDELPF